MAQSALPYTKFATISIKRIYLPGYHSTGYLGLRGLKPFCFSQKKKQSHQIQKYYETSSTRNTEKIGGKAAGLDIKNQDFFSC